MMSDILEDDIAHATETVVCDQTGITTDSSRGNLTIVEDQETILAVKSEGSNQIENEDGNVKPEINIEASRDISNISVVRVNNESTVTESCDKVEAVGGSEETFSKPCQPCLESDKHIDSMLYCLECDEYLCERCVEMHRGVKLTKGHKLVPKEMPDTQRDEYRMIKKENCHIHLHESIEWFCISDDKLCCQLCKATEHRRCESVVAITSAAKTMEVQNIEMDIEETKTKLKAAIEKKQVDITNLEEDRKDSLCVLGKIKTDTENTFKGLVRSLEKENRKTEAKYKKQNENVKSDIENYSKIVKHLDMTTTVLQKRNICDEYKFIQMKKAEQHLKLVQDTMQNDTSEPVSTPIGYERDKLYDQKLNAFDRFGYFDDEKSIYECSTPNRINIMQRYEIDTCVFGISIVGSDKILVTDWRNSVIKLVDTSKGCIKSKLEVPAEPFGVCKLEEDGMFAVTLTSLKQVMFIKVRGERDLINKTSFGTGDYCRGIAFCDSKLFIACGGKENEGPGHIRVFDVKGKQLKTVMADKSGRPWKLEPLPGRNIVLIPGLGQLMEIDSSCYDVTLLTDIPVSPTLASLCFDPEGRIMIGELVSSSIKLLSNDCRLVQTIVTDLPGRPIAVAIDNANFKLFVALEKVNDLFCFQLEKNHWDKPPSFCLH